MLVLPRALTSAEPDREATAEAGARPTRAPTPGQRLREGLAVLGVYAALAVWWLWPLPAAWTDHAAFAQRSAAGSLIDADYDFLVWSFAWGVHALLHQPLAPFDANAFHPTPLALALSDHAFGYLPLFAPPYLLTGNPVLAANLVLFATFPLCAGAAYALARRWLPPPAAIVCGFLFAFYPLRRDGIVHFHQLGVQYIPLLILFAERWLDGGRRRDLAGLAVCFALQTLCSFYIAYSVVLGMGAYLVAALWHRRRSLQPGRVAALAATLAVAALPVVLTGIPYVRLRELGLLPSYGDPGERPALGLVPYFATRHALRYLGESGVPKLGYALAAVAVLPPYRNRRWPTALACVLAVVGSIACFGPTIVVGTHEIWSPYRLLAAVIPGLSTIRATFRFHVLAQLGFALLAGIGAERVASLVASRLAPRARSLARPAVASAVVVLLLATYASLPPLSLYRREAPPYAPPLYGWLREHGDGRALLELPRGVVGVAAKRMLLSTEHWLPLVDGYSSYWSRSPELIHALAGGLPEEDALQRLVDHVDVGFVLVHLDALAPGQRARWSGPYPAGLERIDDAPVASDELLFRVTRAPAIDRRQRLTSTSESLGGTPLRDLEGPCPGEIRLVSDPPRAWRPRTDAIFEIEVANAGDAPWPAAGIYPRHLVQGRAQLRDGGHALGTPARFFFADDVPAGARQRARVRVGAPLAPGDYDLVVWLAQGNDRELERCGLAPLHVPVTVR